ncbi:hypothetical protein CS390_15125 [Pseudomonas sp. HLS-6]|uniref:hypothetical protein n=1 Tax=Pseudomonas sp. HLS-6 TaxID=2049589 RepID=UPI000C190CBE|nr:hypothetical protein [Pseudomonas sp. HLS-6]ATR83777.1 hypothetical protein CS390_15125 [Pseudomonas sp. HLS-6]
MAEKDELGPVNGFDRHQVRKMIDNQVTQHFDHYRMLSFWRRLLAGENDPEEIAKGICMALSGGRYIKKPDTRVINNVTIQAPPGSCPESIAQELKKVLDDLKLQAVR